MKRLDQRVALVTGAAGGLGRATAIRLAREGASLCLTDRADTTEILALVKAEGAKAIAIQADVTDVTSVESLVAATVAEFGALDVLVNIAGISSHGPSNDIDATEFERILRGNLTSVFICCKAALPVMRKRGYGRIVNMSSILGKNGGNPRPWIDPEEQKRAGSLAYGASKAGVHALTYYLAKENARFGITVNSVAPGPIATHMTRNFPETLRTLIPMGRMGSPEDIAQAVIFFAGPAGYVTGQVLEVNGGLYT